MEPRLEGIVLMSEKKIQEEQRNLFAKNMLQVAFAQHLEFFEKDDGSTFDVFLSKYAKPLCEMLDDHPEIRDKFNELLKRGEETTFDFEKMKEILKPYLPLLH